MRPCAAQEVLVQRVYVDVAGSVVVQRRGHGLVAQHRHDLLRRAPVQPRHAACTFIHQALVQDVERIDLIGARWKQRAAWAEHAADLIEEGAAGARQRPHLRRAVARREHRRRAAGAVITRLRLALEECHTHVRRQEVRHRRAGDAGADDDDIEVVGRAHPVMLVH
jgi:hypothetical protein